VTVSEDLSIFDEDAAALGESADRHILKIVDQTTDTFYLLCLPSPAVKAEWEEALRDAVTLHQPDKDKKKLRVNPVPFQRTISAPTPEDKHSESQRGSTSPLARAMERARSSARSVAASIARAARSISPSRQSRQSREGGKERVNPASGLEVTVKNLRHLPKMDMGPFYSCDAYVELKWGASLEKTKIQKNQYNPDFGEVFHFEIAEGEAAAADLVMAVKDWDRLTADQLVGYVVVPAATLNKILFNRIVQDGPFPVKYKTLHMFKITQPYACPLHPEVGLVTQPYT
jgi:hypothetical protein